MAPYGTGVWQPKLVIRFQAPRWPIDEFSASVYELPMGIGKLFNSDVTDKDHRLEVTRVVNEIVRRHAPLSVYLFGSSIAGGTRHESSDIDLAIILSNFADVKPCQAAVYPAPPLTSEKLDLLFYAQDSFSKKAGHGGVCQVIWEEGQLIYGEELRTRLLENKKKCFENLILRNF